MDEPKEATSQPSRHLQPLQNGYVFQYRLSYGVGHTIAVMSDDDGDDLFVVSLGDESVESILKAALHAYSRGLSNGEAIGRGMLAGELRKLIGAAEAGVGE